MGEVTKVLAVKRDAELAMKQKSSELEELKSTLEELKTTLLSANDRLEQEQVGPGESL